MPFKYEINGSIYEFDKEPTEQDIDEIASSVKQQVSKKEEKKPSLMSDVIRSNKVASSMIRSASRGQNPLNAALNPESVPTYLQESQKSNKGYVTPTGNKIIDPLINTGNFATGLQRDIQASVKDMAVEPINYLLGGAIDAVGKTVVGKVAGKVLNFPITPVKWAKMAFKSVRGVEQESKILKQAVVSKISKATDIVNAEKSELLKKDTILNVKREKELAREGDNLANALKKANKQYQTSVSEKSFIESKNVRKELPKVFKQHSSEYGKGLLETLEKNPVSITKEEVVPILEESLVNHGLLRRGVETGVIDGRTPATQAERAIMSEYMRLRGLKEGTQINTADLISKQTILKPDYGKVWGPSEHLQSSVTEGISKIISQKSPEVAKFRSQYAPFLQWKEAVIKEFQPFAGKYANKKGATLLNKFADINKTLNADEQSLLSILEKESGLTVRKNMAQTRPLGKEIENRTKSLKLINEQKSGEIKELAKENLSKINSLIDSKISQLETQQNLSFSDIDMETKRIMDDIKTARIVIGVVSGLSAGASLIKYIKNRLAYNIFGILGR